MATIYTAKGNPILVDDEDYDWLNQYKWHLAAGYAKTLLKWPGGKKAVLMHRFIMDPPDHLYVDHINNNRADNRRQNLRLATHKENQQNQLRNRKKVYDAVTGKYWILRGHDLLAIYNTYSEAEAAFWSMRYGGIPAPTNITIPID
jgi:hypothetical protein